MSIFCRPLNATLSLVDPSRQSTFKVKATSRDFPLDLKICDGSTYAAVSIDAEARSAPAHLSLDWGFEGTFVAKTVDSDEIEKASVSYTHVERDPSYARVFRTPFQTRHLHAGAVGWSGEEAAVSGPSFAEVRSVRHSAHIAV